MEASAAVTIKTREKAAVAGSIRQFNPCAQPSQKLAWLKLSIATALAFGFALSRRLWISSRLFPLSPVSSSLPTVAFPLDYIWFFSLFGLLVGILFVPRPRWLVFIFLTLAGSLSLWDQTRWQPWFYQYLFMLAAIGLYAWTTPTGKKQVAALDACRVIIVFTYIWSGLQKLNANFVKETWPDISGPLLRMLPEAAKKQPAFIILTIPLLEILIALGLVTRRLRNAAVVLAVATHGFVLMLLMSARENSVVWPWNIAMALLVLILFWQDRETTARGIIVPRNSFHALVLLLFGLLPALSFLDLWDSYLSSALYSGNADQAVIYVTPEVIARIPAPVHPHIWTKSQPFFLDVNRWSYDELNVPLYPEPRIYKQITQRICSYAASYSSDVRLRIKEKPNPLTASRKSEFYDCEHLE